MKEKAENQASKQERLKGAAIIALLTAPTIEDAAKEAGVSDTTLYRWLKLPEFQEELRETKKQAVNLALTKLQHSTTAAVQVLQDVAEDKDAPASARVSAAKGILDMALKAVELDDLIQRLKKLEEQIALKG